MKKYLNVLAIAIVISLSSCFGDHNKAPYDIDGVNQDSEWVYGDGKEAQPRQLPATYPEATEETLNKIEDIRNKLYPKSDMSGTVEVAEADSTVVVEVEEVEGGE